MLCQHCQQREAMVHLTKIQNGQTAQIHLCKECAKEYQSFEFYPGMVSEFLQAMFGSKNMPGSHGTEAARCPKCGMTFAQIQKAGRVGCYQCYEAFEPQLELLLRRLHGGSSHVGKVPARSGSQLRAKKELTALKKELQTLVLKEAFEEAAILRDKIKALENGGGES